MKLQECKGCYYLFGSKEYPECDYYSQPIKEIEKPCLVYPEES